jgi:4-diphosphocytidyl-2-C-methyl-D-erythritol kinase
MTGGWAMHLAELAHAKVNLSLDILGRRADGYHDLLTVFQSLRLHDRLLVSKRDDEKISLTCDDPLLPAGPENLVWRAADLLKSHYKINCGVHIAIQKNIPVAAGLGGGSSDAAAVLRALVRLWQLPSERDVLTNLAAGIGADVPFCLEGGTALGRGRGDIIEHLPPCPHFYVVLANPGFAVPTAAVYKAFRMDDIRQHPDTDGICRAIAGGDRDLIGSNLANVLETATFRLYPRVRFLKEKMKPAGFTLMSGSGPTVFSLLKNKNDAEKLYKFLLAEGIKSWLTETVAENKTEVTVGD